jgi:hypothetical protein
MVSRLTATRSASTRMQLDTLLPIYNMSTIPTASACPYSVRYALLPFETNPLCDLLGDHIACMCASRSRVSAVLSHHISSQCRNHTVVCVICSAHMNTPPSPFLLAYKRSTTHDSGYWNVARHPPKKQTIRHMMHRGCGKHVVGGVIRQ